VYLFYIDKVYDYEVSTGNINNDVWYGETRYGIYNDDYGVRCWYKKEEFNMCFIDIGVERDRKIDEVLNDNM
jgi:hypothetical protein